MDELEVDQAGGYVEPEEGQPPAVIVPGGTGDGSGDVLVVTEGPAAGDVAKVFPWQGDPELDPALRTTAQADPEVEDWAASVGFTFEEPPRRPTGAVVAVGGRRSVWDDRLAPLMVHPNRWAKLDFPDPEGAQKTRSVLRKKAKRSSLPTSAAHPSGTWEFATRKVGAGSALYVLFYVPELVPEGSPDPVTGLATASAAPAVDVV